MATRGHVIQIANGGMGGKDGCVCVCVLVSSTSLAVSVTHNLALLSGVDVQEAEKDCTTEATTPTSFDPVGQSETSTMELEELAHEENAPCQEAVIPAAEDTSTVVDVSPQTEGLNPADGGQSKTEKVEESESDTHSGSHSVDELLADWREDLEAFQQMEKDELWQPPDVPHPTTVAWSRLWGEISYGNTSQATSPSLIKSNEAGKNDYDCWMLLPSLWVATCAKARPHTVSSDAKGSF